MVIYKISKIINKTILDIFNNRKNLLSNLFNFYYLYDLDWVWCDFLKGKFIKK